MPDPQPVSSTSPAASRMRRYRARRQNGLRCVFIQIRDTELDALTMRGLLKPEARNDRAAIVDALHSHLDRTLGRAHATRNMLDDG
jgi:hypothetical protein